MKIEFTPGEIDEREARGLVALLMATHGEGVVPASFAQVGGIIRATGPANITVNTNAGAVTFGDETPAVDGYPTEPQPDADMDAPDPVPTGGLDSAGIPWDERIHASTQTKNKDGTWTQRRNLSKHMSEDEIKAIENELRGTPAAPVATPAIPAPPAPAAEPTASEAFAAPAAPAAVPTPPAPAATGDAPSFVDLMKKITTLQGAGKLTKPDLDGYLQSCDVEGVGKLATASADARSNVGAILDSLS